MPILPRSKYPDVFRRSHALKGVFVGGCVARGDGSRFRAKAHAHIRGAHVGWICFLSAKRLTCRELLIHELAHLIAGHGHTDHWRSIVLKLGGTLEPVPGIMRDYRRGHMRTATTTAAKGGA
jgi:hypothetical protein